MPVAGLVCTACTAQHDFGALVYGCPACAAAGKRGQLEVTYRDLPERVARDQRASSGLWGYHAFLPVDTPTDRLALGEGDTPLPRGGPATAGWLELPELYFKNESANPTWSFKDRYDAVSVSVALSLGFRRVVVSSTGNHGAAVAAYAARGGMHCLVLSPPEVSEALVHQIGVYGAQVAITDWEGRAGLIEHLSKARGWFPVGLFMPFAVSNPFGIEGYKTIAFEIVAQLGRAPDAVLFPCARGNGLYGAWKGFEILRRTGQIERSPRLYACQPAGANPLERAFVGGLDYVGEVERPYSVATSVRESTADVHALRAVRASGGEGMSAGDDAILSALGRMGADGLCVEPASALPLACLAELRARGQIRPQETVVCVVTGAGVKWPAPLAQFSNRRARRIAPTAAAVDALLDELGLRD